MHIIDARCFSGSEIELILIWCQVPLLVVLRAPSAHLLIWACSCRFMQFTGCDQQFSIFIGQKMQLTCCHNGDEKRNTTCVDTHFKCSDSSAPTVVPYSVLPFNYQLLAQWLYCATKPTDIVHIHTCTRTSFASCPCFLLDT